MGLLRSANRASAPLNAGIAAGALSVTLTAGKGALFPALAANEYFFAVIQKGVLDTDAREYVKVTARAGDTLTIVRAQGGSAAQAFAAGDVLAQVITAEALDSFVTRDIETIMPSAATVDVGTSRTEDIEITGTTNISSLGTTAPIGTVRNLRFWSGGLTLLAGAGGAGSINPPGGMNYVVAQYEIITVRRTMIAGNPTWLVVNIQGGYGAQSWEKFYDVTPGAVNNLTFTWDVARYRRVRASLIGIKSGTAGNASDDLYMRVYQNSVLKSGVSDYFNHAVYWPAATGSIADGVGSFMPLTYGGQGNTPEEMHGEVFIDSPGTNRAGVFGLVRSLTNGGQRSTNLLSHQVLVQDAQVNGVLIGFANGGIFFSGVGSIVLEGLRR